MRRFARPLTLLTVCALACGAPRDRGDGRFEPPTGEELPPDPEDPVDPQDPVDLEGSGVVEPGLAGIWGEIWSSGHVLEVGVSGELVTVSSGFSAQLKVRPNGAYELVVDTGGYSASCAFVQLTDRSEGFADFGAERLELRPRVRTLEVHGCSEQGTRTLANDPIRFVVTISPYVTAAREPSLQAELRGGPYGATLKRLDPAPVITPNPQPADFVLGDAPGFTELLGLWTGPEADLGFYDPTTGAATFIEDNLRENRWIQLFDDGTYQLAGYLLHTGGAGGGGCKRDLVYFERGTTLFSALIVNDSEYAGDVRFDGAAGTLVERIRDCGADDGVRTHSLVPGPSYARWGMTPGLGRITLGCIFPQSRMQFATCVSGIGHNTYVKR